MPTVWITYAWEDNKSNDVDFIAQELASVGLDIKLDRWNIGAGKRLWEQIDSFISDPAQSDVWLLIASNNSLASEACKEEFAYALNRALKSRGEVFPVIALFLTNTDESLIPAGIQTRLYLSIMDPTWKERIKAAADGRLPNIPRENVKPYFIAIHSDQPGDRPWAIEVRPRAGIWAPFFASIPLNEKDAIDPQIMHGPRDVPTKSGLISIKPGIATPDGTHWCIEAANQANPTTSYYIWCKQLPSHIAFGVAGGEPVYIVEINS